MFNLHQFFLFGILLRYIAYHIFIHYFLLRQFDLSKVIYVQYLIIKSDNLVFKFVYRTFVLVSELI